MNTQIPPKETDSLACWLNYLEHAHSKPIDMGLERVRSVAEQLDLLQPAPYIITVAGTNGKGSTCRLLEVALMKAGLRVGVYSSPHLIRYNERVRIQGELLPDEWHIKTFAMIQKEKQVSLSYFEFSTLSALALFKQAKLDVVILEVGLGGRLDATNIVDPNFAVITSIDIDHVAFLGDNREVIGREKAGIFRPNIPVVIGEPDCPQSIHDHAIKLQCHAFYRGEDWQIIEKNDRLQWQSNTLCFDNLPQPRIPVPNVGTALAVLTQLPFSMSEKMIMEAIAEAQMPGRFQTLTANDFAHFQGRQPKSRVIIDVGHNPHAARYLASRLQAVKKGKIFAIFSALEDKDLSGIVEPLDQLIDSWYCVGLDCWRGQEAQMVESKLLAVLPQAKTSTYKYIGDAAVKLFSEAKAEDIILVFGSFHTVADFMLWLENSEK